MVTRPWQSRLGPSLVGPSLLATVSLLTTAGSAIARSVYVPACEPTPPNHYAVIVFAPTYLDDIRAVLPPGATATVCAANPSRQDILIKIGHFPQANNAHGFAGRIRADITTAVEVRNAAGEILPSPFTPASGPAVPPSPPNSAGVPALY
ncbi:hypothetical protein OOK60_12280 [Trichothermofontia sichuanensis B231]|uniref:hypothetical protein n=1 Tax=Trichothermofontia sichuanensis TaxID=3045816 RepID=UPI002247ADBE|nr:hypothetical protein [Trichothermofontia sichuanensis]UZQ53280.1 hypothetical protein OOK60_12280 [Trichothermofontia sichuanensis B231]